MSEAETVTVSRAELLEALRHDCVTYLSFYLQEELTLEVPDFHIEIWDEFLELIEQVNHPSFIVGRLKKLLAVPREHAKTTLVKLAVILFMRYSKLGFCLYVSKSVGNAQNAIRDVIDWLTSPQEVELYGAPVRIKHNENEGVFIYQIHVPGQKELKTVIFRTVGSQHQVRGMLILNRRPDFVVFDDIEDLDTVANPQQQEKLDDWMLSSVMKATARYSLVIFIGNMIRSTSLLARLSKDPEWNPTVFGAIIRSADGNLRPLWPDRWSLTSLLADYRSYRRLGKGHLWEAELMNLSQDKIFGEMLSDAIRIPLPSPEEVTAGFICIDPAFGQHAWNDESAITVHVHAKPADGINRDKAGSIPHVVDSRHGRWTEIQLFQEAIELAYYWNLTTIVIESVAAQRLLIPLFKLFCVERQIMPDVFSFLPITGGKEAKAARIVSFRKTVGSGSYGVVETQEELFTLLEEYTADVEHDDLIDSAALGPIAWASYGELITASGVTNIAGRLMQLQDVNMESASELSVAIY